MGSDKPSGEMPYAIHRPHAGDENKDRIRHGGVDAAMGVT
jgi:hypothetical protein